MRGDVYIFVCMYTHTHTCVHVYAYIKAYVHLELPFFLLWTSATFHWGSRKLL